MKQSTPSSQRSLNTRSNQAQTLLDARIEYTNHIINTHFNTFVYVDTKLQALLSISAFLLTASTFVYTSATIATQPALSLFIISCASQLIAVGFCIWHVKPKMDSGVGNNRNPRSVIGTIPFTKQQYLANVRNLSKTDMLTFNCGQIYGLAHIHKRGEVAIFRAALFVSIGIAFLVCALMANGLAVADKKPSSTAVRSTASAASAASAAVQQIDASASKPPAASVHSRVPSQPLSPAGGASSVPKASGSTP